jgi:hypothetical protein
MKMYFRFKIEDLAAVLLLMFAAFIVGMACSYRAKAKGLHTNNYHRVELTTELPQIMAKVIMPKRKLREARATQVFKIGIIDTGYNKMIDDMHVKLCDKGHYDFATGTPTVGHSHFHGTAVAQTMVSELEGVNYCLVIYQVGGPLGITGENIAGALRRAQQEGLAAVNISLEGNAYSFDERTQLQRLADKGTAVFVAAGNRHLNLDDACFTYPSCYRLPNMYIVGATQDNGEFPATYSNYGSTVQVWEDGVVSFNGDALRGTSFASPRALGDYVRSLSYSTVSN